MQNWLCTHFLCPNNKRNKDTDTDVDAPREESLTLILYAANDKENVSHSLNYHNKIALTWYVSSLGWVKSGDRQIFMKDAEIQCSKKELLRFERTDLPSQVTSHNLRTENSRDLFMNHLILFIGSPKFPPIYDFKKMKLHNL